MREKRANVAYQTQRTGDAFFLMFSLLMKRDDVRKIRLRL